MEQFTANRKKSRMLGFKMYKECHKLVTQREIYLYTFYFNVIIQIRFLNLLLLCFQFTNRN